jgi:hypothetical protein
MLKTIITLAVSAVILSAAEPYLGTWKANVAKSKYSPGPAPKSHVATYTKDGEWVVLKTDTVAADGQTVSASNRYKRDGKEYPFDGPTVGKGTIAVKAIGDNITDATLKSDGGRTVMVHTVVSKDGKTRTQTSTGTNADGKKLHNTVVFEKQ